METNLKGLIVSDQGRLRECVQAFLLSLPQIDTVDFSENLDAALEVLTTEKIDFALVYMNTSDLGLQNIVRSLKETTPGIKALVIAENTVQEQLVRVAGADGVVMQGAPAEKYMEALYSLIPSEDLKEKLELCANATADKEMRAAV